MKTTENITPAEIPRVAVQLPLFWAKRPAVWFTQAEAQFTLASISSKQIKFCYVISQLDHQYAAEVEDIITSPLERELYPTLRTELARQLSSSRKQRTLHLLTLEEIGDRKPSQFFRHLWSLTPDVPDDFLCNIWSSQLPPNVQAILAGQPQGDFDTTAHCVDHISKAAPQPVLVSVASLPNCNALLQHIEDLSRQVAALSAEQPHPCSSSRAVITKFSG